MPRTSRGFTLIELLIAVVVVGILAAVALPSYNSQMRKARRAEAHSALMQIQAAQERWRTNNTQYAGALASLGVTTPTSGGNYALAVSGASATGYTATATAQGKQIKETTCATLSITVAGPTTTYAPNPDASDANRACWGR